MTPFADMTKGQQAFVEQMARKSLVEWCDALATDSTRTAEGLILLNLEDPYVQYARDRKSPWISQKDKQNESQAWFKVLSVGWTTASTFLKR